MKRNLFIRADGNTQIGLGHLVRCLALAEMVSNEFTIIFICKSIPDFFQYQLNDQSIEFKIIQKEEEIISFIQDKDIVVVDHYDLDAEYHRLIKKNNGFVVCIDDIHTKLFDADIIINPAPEVSEKDYQTSKTTKFAFGLDYVLLRKPFLEFAKKGNTEFNKGEVTICFGGSDIKNLTLKTLKSIQESSNFKLLKKVHLVIGASYPFKDSLIPYLSEKVNIHENISSEKMLEHLSKSEIIIVPSSGILIESLVTQNKIIAGMYVDNQKHFYQNLKKMNAFFDAKHFESEAILKAFDNAIISTKKTNKLIDGYSDQRIQQLFNSCH